MVGRVITFTYPRRSESKMINRASSPYNEAEKNRLKKKVHLAAQRVRPAACHVTLLDVLLQGFATPHLLIRDTHLVNDTTTGQNQNDIQEYIDIPIILSWLSAHWDTLVQLHYYCKHWQLNTCQQNDFA